MFSLRETRALIFWAVAGGIALIAILIAARGGIGKAGKWICRDGQWIAQGRTGTEKPRTPCY